MFKPRLEQFHRHITGVEPVREAAHKQNGSKVGNDGGTDTNREKTKKERRLQWVVGGLSVDVLCFKVRKLLVFIELFIPSLLQVLPL